MTTPCPHPKPATDKCGRYRNRRTAKCDRAEQQKSHASFGLGAAGKGPAIAGHLAGGPPVPVARAGRCGGEDRHRPHTCWRAAQQPSQPSEPVRAIDERTRARHAAVHDLLDQGMGLLECSRRLGRALNTVKRYARPATAEQLQRPPRYGRTLVDPYREHLRGRLATEPNVPVTRLLAEIRELGYTGSANLLVRYLNHGRAQAERAAPAAAPRRVDHEQNHRAARTRPQPPRRAAGRLPAPHRPRR
jgi:hypothetical protein